MTMTLCADCQAETLSTEPGVPTEYYMVHDPIWQAAGKIRGYLCIGCLEARLGRQLTAADFTIAKINDLGYSNIEYAWSWRSDRAAQQARGGKRVSGPRVRNADLRYNWAHRKERDRLLAALVEGSPCPQTFIVGGHTIVCGGPLFRWQRLDLGHLDDGTVAIVHMSCNRSAAQQKQVVLAKMKRSGGQAPPPREPPPRPVSRPW